MQSSIRLHAQTFGDIKTYVIATLFIIGNIALPRIFHILPQGGVTWLPIYFFTLIGAYLYGWRVGLLTALASPVINSLLFAMPAISVLPTIVVKSSLLALAAGWASWHFRRVNILLLTAVVLAYQIGGTLCEWLLTGNAVVAFHDFRIGILGMLMQIFAGYAVIHSLSKR